MPQPRSGHGCAVKLIAALIQAHRPQIDAQRVDAFARAASGAAEQLLPNSHPQRGVEP